MECGVKLPKTCVKITGIPTRLAKTNLKVVPFAVDVYVMALFRQIYVLQEFFSLDARAPVKCADHKKICNVVRHTKDLIRK